MKTSVLRPTLVQRLQQAVPRSPLSAYFAALKEPRRLDGDRFEKELRGHTGAISAPEEKVVQTVRATLLSRPIFDRVEDLERFAPSPAAGQSSGASGPQQAFKGVKAQAALDALPTLSLDGKQLFQLDGAGNLNVFDRETGKVEHSFSVGDIGFSSQPTLSADGKKLFVPRTESDGSSGVVVVDLTAREVELRIGFDDATGDAPGRALITPCSVSPNGKQLCVAFPRSGELLSFDTSTGAKQWSSSLPAGINLTHGSSHSQPLFTPDGQWVLFGHDDNSNNRRMAGVHASDGSVEWSNAEASRLDCQHALSPDGRTVYIGGSDSLRAVSASSGRPVWTTQPETLSNTLRSQVVVSSDGRYLAMQAKLGINLIEAATGKVLHHEPMENWEGPINAPVFTADSKALVLQDSLGRYRRLELDPPKVVKLGSELRAERRIATTRGFTLSADGQWAFESTAEGLRAVRLDEVTG
jgi:outer membrane protein assembly factor BamB